MLNEQQKKLRGNTSSPKLEFAFSGGSGHACKLEGGMVRILLGGTRATAPLMNSLTTFLRYSRPPAKT
jgi:hypothetical protein